MALPRKCKTKIIMNGSVISDDINGHIVSLVFTDAEEGECDDIKIVIDDRERIWSSAWLDYITASKGAELICEISLYDDGYEKLLRCGKFEIDEVSFSGPPSTLTIKGTSLPYSSGVRNEAKSKAWESYTLADIAGEIASGVGDRISYNAAVNPEYKRAEQVNETDISFLLRLCEEYNLCLKYADGCIVIYDTEYCKNTGSVYTVEYGKSDIVSWSFETGELESVYSACVVSYTSPESGEVISAKYSTGGSGSVLKLEKKVENEEEALACAKSEYEKASREEFRGSFTLAGNPALLVGCSVDVSGFGVFDGKYVISSAVHSVSGGYTTKIEVERL